MGLVEWLITISATILAICVFSSLLFVLKKRGDKRLKDGVIRTYVPKTLQGFFLGFAIFVFFGGAAGIIYCAITDPEHTTAGFVAMIVICILLFSGLGLFGFLFVNLNFVVATDEGIEAHRLFRKTKFYRYEEIGGFRDTTEQGMMGGLEGFDAEGKKIFAIEAVSIGAKAVADRLREKGVRPLPVYRKPHV